MKKTRENELRAETIKTMAAWLWALIDKNGKEDEVSGHFTDEMDYNDMSKEEALFCQDLVKKHIAHLGIDAEKYEKAVG